MKFRKLNKKVSIPAVTEIMILHNPLKVMNATQLARKINLDKEMRIRAGLSRVKGS